MWRQFRHCNTSYDGCRCSNSGADHNCCADDDGRSDNYGCTTHYDRCTNNHGSTRYHCSTNNDKCFHLSCRVLCP